MAALTLVASAGHPSPAAPPAAAVHTRTTYIGTPEAGSEAVPPPSAAGPRRLWRPDGCPPGGCEDPPALKAAAAAAPANSYVMLFTGDTLVHEAVALSARRHGADTYDFSPMLEKVAPLIQEVDLAVCHLEVPLDPASERLRGWPRFSAPAEIGAALAGAGFDGCSTASNHSLDRGLDGLYATLDVLDGAGLGHAGTARSPKESSGRLYDLGGLTVGHGSYAYGVSAARLMRNAPWAANTISVDRIAADAAELRRRGAAFVVISLHWGIEYSAHTSGGQRRLAEHITALPEVDLVIGHHPHVLQPVEEVGGKLVAYSMGNFLSNQIASCCTAGAEEGALLLVRVEGTPAGWRVQDTAFVPTWIDRNGGHVITPALGNAAERSRYRSRLARAAERAARVLGLGEEGLSVGDALRWLEGLAPSQAQPVNWQSRAA